MQVDELLPFLRENQENLIKEIRDGKYEPNPVQRVEIPKETKDEFRKLGVPTVVEEAALRCAEEGEYIAESERTKKGNGVDGIRRRRARYEPCFFYVKVLKFFNNTILNKNMR